MAKKHFNLGKISLLSSTALTRSAATLGALSMMLGATSAQALDANALPQGGTVVGGAATITTAPATLTVNQSSNRTVIDWRSFDIGSNATANFVQPGASSIAVNRVNGTTNPSDIQGSLNANGQVWILNPNGVMFGKSARIDVAGIVASTGNINKDAFMRGDNRLQFSGSDGGSVINEGMISVADGGLAAFVAPSVRNSGVIQARVGKVTLAAGTTFTLDLAGDDLIELGLGANNAMVDQSGKLLADGSIVNITAKAASDVVNSVINISGTVLASGVTEKGGRIVLTADNITTGADATLAADGGTNGDGGSIYAYANKTGTYNGAFSAKGGSASGDGGSVETSGKKVQIAEGISVDTTATNGTLGDWSIDPDDLEVIGSGSGALAAGTNDETSTITAATVVAGLNSTNVILQANNSITVNEAITSAATGAGKGALALNDQNGGGLEINLNAKITLGAGKTLTGQGTVVNVGSAGSIQNGVNVASTGGATVTVADGNFAENVTINKSNLTLQSQNGSGSTTITGQAGSQLGAVHVTSGSNNFQLGGIGQGFKVIGIDGTPGLEKAAVYFQGTNSGSTVQGNIITANGDAGLQTEYGQAVTGLTIDSNTFDGKTFAGATAGDLGFSNQFTAANVPRQLVTIGSGPTTTTTTNITFTNNQVTGTAGGLNGSAQEQGNTLVTIDAVGATITGNTFAGTTTRYGDALRARGSNTTISGNTFDGTNMGAATNMVDVKAGALSGTFADLIANNTWSNGWAYFNHVAADGYYYVFRGIQNAIDGATAGDTVNVGAGSYAAGTNINKGLTVAGADGAKVTVGLGQHGFDINSSDVTLSGFEIAGPVVGDQATLDWGSAGTSWGVFVTSKSSSNVTISDNHIHDVRTGILIANSGGNGGEDSTLADAASGAISNNVIENTKGGILIQYRDGHTFNIAGNSEGANGNEWGIVTGLQQTKISSDPTLLRQQQILDWANNNNGMTVLDRQYATGNRSSVTVDATGTATAADDFGLGNGVGNERQPINNIAEGVKAVVAGGSVNVNAGNYALGTGQLNINKALTLAGAGEGVTNISTTSAGYGISVTGNYVTLSGFTFNANPTGSYSIKVSPTGAASNRLTNFAINNVTVNGSKRTGLDLNGVNGATIDHVTVTNTTSGNGISLTDSANVDVTNTTTSGNAWGGLAIYQANRSYDQQVNNISVDGTNSFGEANPVYMEDESDGSTAYGGANGLDFGTITVAGYTLAGHNDDPSDKFTFLNNTVTGLADWLQVKGQLAGGYVTGWTGSAADNTFYVGHATDTTAMSIAAAQAASSTGNEINVGSGDFAEAVTVADARNFKFDGSTISSYTQNVASSIGGTVTAAGGFVLNGLTTLLSNTVLNGAVNAGSVAGAGSTLEVNNGATVLNGNNYTASALTFNGTSTTLTQGTTTFDTSAVGGDMTFTGPIFGTTDGAQNVVFNAGPGTGLVNGDITMANAGTNTVWLGNMTATGDNLTGHTVYVGGSYNATLAGNETFLTDTLHTRGNVTSNVGGNATGPIIAGGTVNVAAGGNFSGNVTAPTSTVTAQNIFGGFSGGTANLNATNSLNVTTDLTNLNVNSPSGTVNGTFDHYTGVGGPIVVNGKTQTGSNPTNPNQIVVEGFTLPAGAFVTNTGQIVLPTGMLVGLVSPAAGPGAVGGKPRVVIVHNVQMLGQLLAEGYTAIVVDLSKDDDEIQQIALN